MNRVFLLVIGSIIIITKIRLVPIFVQLYHFRPNIVFFFKHVPIFVKFVNFSPFFVKVI